MPTPMADIEVRLGIQPIHELLDARAVLINRVADLRAKYGGFGTFEHLRKMELARLAGLIRAQAVRDKIKVTAAEVDDLSHDHADYRDFITTATKQRAEWVRLEAQIEALDATMMRANTVAKFCAAEARL